MADPVLGPRLDPRSFWNESSLPGDPATFEEAVGELDGWLNQETQSGEWSRKLERSLRRELSEYRPEVRDQLVAYARELSAMWATYQLTSDGELSTADANALDEIAGDNSALRERLGRYGTQVERGAKKRYQGLIARGVLPKGGGGGVSMPTASVSRVSEHADLYLQISDAWDRGTVELGRLLGRLLEADPAGATDIIAHRLARSSGVERAQTLMGLVAGSSGRDLSELGEVTLRQIDLVLSVQLGAPNPQYEEDNRLGRELLELEAEQASGGSVLLTAKNVEKLADKAGRRISRSEREMMHAYLLNHLSRFTRHAREELVAHFGISMPWAAQLSLEEELPLGETIAEASGVASLPNGFTLIVDDATGLYARSPTGQTEHLLQLEELEGLTVSPDGKTAYVVSEDDRKVRRLDLELTKDGVVAGEAEVIGRLGKSDAGNNDGWEGLEYIPAELSPSGEPMLLASQEGGDRELALFTIEPFHNLRSYEMNHAAKALLRDVSDIAVDPQSGHIFVLSDQSRQLVELEYRGDGIDDAQLTVIGVTPLDLPRDAKPEGLGFDGDGNLLLVCDGWDMMQRFTL